MFPLPYTMLSVLYVQGQIDAGIAAPGSAPDVRWPARASRPHRDVTRFRASGRAITLGARRPAAAGPAR